MRPVPTHISFLLLLFSSLVTATNFTQCLENFKNGPDTIGGVDSRGHPTSPAQAVGLTYKACTAQCGDGAEGFIWNDFAQLFSSWLLPWLALLSQLPFGSGNYADDFISVVMSVGSPALAAYSLTLTALNARLVYRRAQRIQHESKNDVTRALISLQQTPLELTKDDRLLAFIPINDQWRREIVERLNRKCAWTVAAGTAIAWVVVAFVFTLIDSFTSLHDPVDDAPTGHAVGTLWLWLLCLVIGWLWVPTFTRGELGSAIHHANQKAVKKAAKRIRLIKQKADEAYNSAMVKTVVNKFPRRMHIPRRSKKHAVDHIHGAGDGEVRVKIGSTREDTKHIVEQTELKSSISPSPIHPQSTASLRESAESQRGHGHSVRGDKITANSAAGPSRSTAVRPAVVQSVSPEMDRLLIPKDECGSLNRDELRLSATFNYSRIMRYLVLVDDVLRALNRLTSGCEKRHVSEVATQPTESGVFPTGALISMFSAAAFALVLQCGITAAATIIMVFTPTVGVGCRSLGYVLYGGIAILILFLTIVSTILARISETRISPSTTWSIKGFTGLVAVTLRRFCLLLAFVNATGTIVLSCLHFSRTLDTCYCNSSVIGNGSDSYIIISFDGQAMRTYRIWATGLAAACIGIYMTFIWFVTTLPKQIYQL